MHVELADLFRCPAAHAESWLVLAADHTRRRVVLDGTLGCPVCGAEYRIEAGVTHFGPAHPANTNVSAEAPVRAAMDGEAAMRAAALLNAIDASATLGFVGESLVSVRAVQGIAGARCIAFDAPDADDARRWYAASDAPLAVVAGGSQSLARGALSGLWLAPGAVLHAEPLRARGRLVASLDRAVPDGFTELARDAMEWVAELDAASDDGRTASSGLTQLRRRR